MKKYYINQIPYDSEVPSNSELYHLADSTEGCEDSHIWVLGLPRKLLKNLPNKDTDIVIGYLHADTKEKEGVQKGNRFIWADWGKLATIYDKPQMRRVGYVETCEENIYLQVTRPVWFLFWFILGICLLSLILCPFKNDATDVVFGEDIPVHGEIIDEKIEPLSSAYFNIIMNTTPILKEGKMNIRVENSSRNTLDCHVKVIAYVDGVEQLVYDSPLIAPDSFIEFATVEEVLPEGICDGKAIFTYFDEEGKQLDVTTSVQLIITVKGVE